ncbi:MAG: S8 family serine peptidase [Acidobacteriota bacterium]
MAASTPSKIAPENFVPRENTTSDLSGHGTHVAGILAGNRPCRHVRLPRLRRFSGMASLANLVNLRVLNAKGNAVDETVIRALDRAVRLRSTFSIRVINLSLGRIIPAAPTQGPLWQAVERAWAAGMVVAGNRGRENRAETTGCGTLGSPGNDLYVITVGATRERGRRTRRRSDGLPPFAGTGHHRPDREVRPGSACGGTTCLRPGRSGRAGSMAGSG